MPDLVTIVMTTYFPPEPDGNNRFGASLQALRSWQTNLLPLDAWLHLHIADDGSNKDQYLESLKGEWYRNTFTPTTSVQERHGVGASLNAGFKQAFQEGDFALYMVDDWQLKYQCDLEPWIQLMKEDPSIGMVRLGPPHPDLTGVVTHDNDRWYIRLDRHNFAFGFRPALFHKRMFEQYGPFDEDVNSLEAERLYSERFNASGEAADIIYALPYPFDHIYGVELSALNPRG